MAIRSLIRVDLNDNQDVFICCSYIPGEKLNVKILNLKECKAYSGYVSDIDLRSQAAVINMTFSTFVSLTKKALTQNEPENDHFLFSLKKNCSGILFQWKSIDDEETIVDIGSIKVTESDFGHMIKEVFLILSEEMLTLNKKVADIGTEFSNVKKEKEKALKLLSNTADLKDRVENELFSKFVLVLNEKKRKINDLKECESSVLPSNIKSKKKTKTVHEISESSDEADSDFDRDMAGPSTSKHNNSLPFFDDDDDESSSLKISPSKRRNRNNVSASKTLNPHAPKSTLKDIIMESESEDDLLNDL